MARPAIVVDENKLRQIIGDCETKKQYTTRNELWQDVAAVYGASPAWVYLRVEELGIPVKTPKGRKGRQKGEKVATGVKIPRSVKFEKNQEIVKSFGLLEQTIKQEQKGRFLPIFQRVKAGSMKAAVKLKCLDCSNFQPIEIKNCPCTDCPLYAFRPYQKVLTGEDDE